MKKIFENAYFGKPYKTRNERKAIYLWANKKDGHSLIVEDEKKPHHYNDEGKWYSLDNENQLDIISEWKVKINEEDLNKLAYDDIFNVLNQDYFDGKVSFNKIKEIYKAGYRKAMEE